MRVLNVTGGISSNAGEQTAHRLKHYFPNCDITCGIFESSNPSFEKFAAERDIDTVFFGPSITDRFEKISLLPGIGYPRAAGHALMDLGEYDLIHVYGGPLFHGPVGAMYAATSRCSMITRFNGYVPLPDTQPKRSIVKTVVRWMLTSDGIVFNSNAQKQDIIDTYDVCDASNMRVIPPGVNQTKFGPVGDTTKLSNKVNVDDSTTVIGSVITPRPVKRLDRAFDIIGTLSESYDVTYVILGGSSHLREYRQLAAEKGVDKHIYWGGYIEQDELATWYSLFDMTILTSEWESFGMSLTESYLCETPCVAFDVGGMSDQIVNGETGYLVEPYDTNSFVTALERLVTDPEQRAEFGIRGREYVQKRFTLERVSSQYSDLISSVTSDNR
jgi:glycosyltransferase involved in cell wall biosynthesis